MKNLISKKSLSIALTATLLFNFTSGVLAKGSASPAVNNDNLGVYYELYVNSFYDTNKDGHGDLKGIIEKLDYLNDGNSHTNYKDLIRIRQSSSALIKGDIKEFKTGDSRVMGYTRTYEDDSVLVLHNLSSETVTINLTDEEFKDCKVMFSTSQHEKIKHADGKIQITIPAYTTILLK
ncbi:alpha-glucosidase C-terminal domain-containing protein [Clostridium sp. DJ247]|uniref:alpha-glucosidase C-terminal domain-containing protein n=1 Tax=Clostridium sp. DJ247 TaxID=2726188 RepID=UPI0016252552|nr:alpha-glucosidase C-terminal domain-containing protein [Clostridium sp. DJ247]MBC2582229.1 DUF3459 domain-containing protein [Clostridium sp. DJ247]